MCAYRIDGGSISHDFLQLLPIGAGYFACDGGVYSALYVNNALTRLLGLDGGQIAAALSGPNPGFLHPEDSGRIALTFYKAAVSGGAFRETARARGASGNYRWVEININAEPQTDGTSILCLLITDINARMERQQKLDSTYSQLLGVMNNTPGGIVVFDTINNRSLVGSFASQGMGKLLRGTMAQIETIYRRNPYDFVHPDDRESVIRTVEEALRNLSGFQLSMRLRTVPGDYIWVSASGTVDTTENQRILYMSFMDSSTEAEFIHIQTQILNNFVRSQYEHICYIDGMQNTFRVLSSSTSTGFFLPEQGDNFDADMAALVCRAVVPEEQKELLARLCLRDIIGHLQNSDDLEYYCTVSAGDSKLRYKKIWLSWIDKELKTIALVSSDVTEEHKRSEASRAALKTALRAAEQASAAKTEFLSRMSHDIRTPLNAIIGYTEMSLEEPALGASVRDHLTKAEASSKFLLSLINDILNMSRIESGKLALKESAFQMSSFLDAISSIVSSQCAAKSIQYNCSIEGNTHSSYKGDKLKIQQILLNIVGNAVKFTPEGGTISLQVGEVTCGDPPIVRFTVKDSGCGISAEFRKHLFEPFAQERRALDSEVKGTGLGLAICKSLTTMMGGEISVESETGRGSEFKIDLPLHPAENTEVKEKGPGTPAIRAEDLRNFRGKHVLLAEDNPLNREIAQHVLEKANLAVDCAGDGSQACRMFGASSEGFYSAVLMDIRMPVMDGLEAARGIRAMERSDKNIPIIAMSANAFEEDIRLALTNGMNAYTIKPIDVPQLYATLRQFIH